MHHAAKTTSKLKDGYLLKTNLREILPFEDDPSVEDARMEYLRARERSLDPMTPTCKSSRSPRLGNVKESLVAAEANEIAFP